MTPEQYAASQAAITAGLASYVQRVGRLYVGPRLTFRDWLTFLEFIFPEVKVRYEQSARLGREFYDSQRRKYHPELQRNDRLLSELQFEQFVDNMKPAMKGMSQADSSNAAVTRAALTAVREVEMAARRQVIGSVKNDPEVQAKVDLISDLPRDEVVVREADKPKPTAVSEVRKPSKAVSEARAKADAASDPGSDLLKEVGKLLDKRSEEQKRELQRQRREASEQRRVEVSEPENEYPTSGTVIGWARVATGSETCAWCLMLISRGAELNHKGNFAYREAATAGIKLDDETALDLWQEAGGNLAKFRELIYDDEEDESYMERWHTGCDCLAVPVFDLNDWPGRDQARDALQLWIDAGKEASELIDSGKSRTKNKYTETLNALRRRLERGDISMSNYAVAA